MDTNVLVNKSEEELNFEEKWRVEHIKMHEQHRGHESMHAEMLFILLFTLILAQIILFEWKKLHFKSYQLVTLIAMWIIPFGLSLKNHWWRFIFFWLVSSCITGLVVRKAVQKPISGTTPRLVYKWFLFIYKVSYVLGIIGHVIMLAAFFGLNLLFEVKPHVWIDCGGLFLFYGLYFGVLGRDVAEICADKMASHIGYYTPGSMPTRTLEVNVCAVCGNRLLVSEHEEGVIENTYILTCKHVFHEFCIRGWCIVGKKQTCPYCKEKVDLKKMFRNPWERPHVFYGQLLDWIRWLVAWQPLILFLVQGINWGLGLEFNVGSSSESKELGPLAEVSLFKTLILLCNRTKLKQIFFYVKRSLQRKYVEKEKNEMQSLRKDDHIGLEHRPILGIERNNENNLPVILLKDFNELSSSSLEKTTFITSRIRRYFPDSRRPDSESTGCTQHMSHLF